VHRVRVHIPGGSSAHPYSTRVRSFPEITLRRIPPKIITDEECQVVEAGMRTYAKVKDYKIDVRGNALLIYTAIAGD